MGRVLGKAEYGDGSAPRYFIHNDVEGWTFPPLFVDADAAWRACDAGDWDKRHLTTSTGADAIQVVRTSLAWGHMFQDGEKPYGEVIFALATRDRLIVPLVRYGGDRFSFVRRAGVLHVAREVDGGLSGCVDEPVCVDRWISSESDERVIFEDFYGKFVSMCPFCFEKLLK